jgi:hypothetical protein
VAILMLSVVQFGNMLWGFQMAWYLVLVALALSLFLVDRLTLSWVAWSGAAVAGLVASFSLLQGLLVWPAGLLLLYHRGRRWTQVVGWIITGVAAIVLYTHNYNSDGAAPRGAAIHDPIGSAKFFAASVAAILGIPFDLQQPYNPWLLLLGFLIIALALGICIRSGVQRDDHSGAPFGVALILIGLLFIASVTEGRGIFGAVSASSSRYTTFELLVPTGIYLALLGRVPVRSRRNPDLVGGGAGSGSLSRGPQTTSIGRGALVLARVIIGLVIVLQVTVSLPNGIKGARNDYLYQSDEAKLLANFNHIGDGGLALLDVYATDHFIRHQAAILKRHHLSLFANS